MKTQNRRKLNVCLLLIALMMISACQKNDDDQLFKDQLIGTWKSTNSLYKIYTFNDDNTFIDTTFYLFSDDITGFKVDRIISGEYLVDNGQLKFSNIKMTYFRGEEDENTLSLSQMYEPNHNISFDGDILVLTQKDIFESNSNSNSGIVGKWSHDKLVAIYDKRIDYRSTGGTVKGIYEFLADNTVKWQYEVSYDNSVDEGNSSTVYNLIDSKLTINQWGLNDLSVSWTKNKMIWTYSDRTFQRK